MYLKYLIPLLPLTERLMLFNTNARTIIINGNTGTRFTLSEDGTELLLGGEPCGIPAGTEGSLCVTGINAHGGNIIVTVDA